MSDAVNPEVGRQGAIAEDPESDPIDPADHAEHFERIDRRWPGSRSSRDWLILVAMIALYLVWTGAVYLLEPGIR